MVGTCTKEVIVIGGGIVGVCCAYYLAEAGISVTLLERDHICSGCSFGNAGLIVPSYSVPLATSDVLFKALKSLVTEDGPFRIDKPVDWELLKWLLRFALACNSRQASRSMRVLRDLIRSSMRLYEELAARVDFGYTQKGSLALFATERELKSGLRVAHALSQLGIDSRPIPHSGLPQFDPVVSSHLAGAIHYPQDAQLFPADFVAKMASLASRSGVNIHTGVEVLGFNTADRSVELIRTSAGTFRPAAVVIAAGAWSSALAHQLSLHLPLRAGKGYSFSVDSSEFCPRIPLLLSEAKVAITPMGDTVRFTGGLELSGLDTSINIGRVNTILRSTSRYLLKGAPTSAAHFWSGLRPCTPDGLPVISRSPTLHNLFIATGHGMLGVTLGPITGKIVSDLVRSQAPSVGLSELSIERFG